MVQSYATIHQHAIDVLENAMMVIYATKSLFVSTILATIHHLPRIVQRGSCSLKFHKKSMNRTLHFTKYSLVQHMLPLLQRLFRHTNQNLFHVTRSVAKLTTLGQSSYLITCRRPVKASTRDYTFTNTVYFKNALQLHGIL